MISYQPEQNNTLTFEFPDELVFQKFDAQNVSLPHGMKLVDLVIETDNNKLIVEIKDPSNPNAQQYQQAQKFITDLKNDTVISHELTPKARDTYTFLHLMKEDTKPLIFVALLGLDALSELDQNAILLTFRDRLMNHIRKESDKPWERKHIEDCAVLTLETWNKTFPDWQVHR